MKPHGMVSKNNTVNASSHFIQHIFVFKSFEHFFLRWSQINNCSLKTRSVKGPLIFQGFFLRPDKTWSVKIDNFYIPFLQMMKTRLEKHCKSKIHICKTIWKNLFLRCWQRRVLTANLFVFSEYDERASDLTHTGRTGYPFHCFNSEYGCYKLLPNQVPIRRIVGVIFCSVVQWWKNADAIFALQCSE